METIYLVHCPYRISAGEEVHWLLMGEYLLTSVGFKSRIFSPLLARRRRGLQFLTLRARNAGGDGTGVSLLDAGTDGMAVIFGARGCRTLVIIDACRSGSEPGAIFEGAWR